MQERSAWIRPSSSSSRAGSIHVLGEVGDILVAEIDYQGCPIWNVGLMIAAMIVVTILSTIGTAIGTAISTEVAAAARGAKSEPGAAEAAVEAAVKRLDRKDERDVGIERLGNVLRKNPFSRALLSGRSPSPCSSASTSALRLLDGALVLAGFTAAVVKVERP